MPGYKKHYEMIQNFMEIYDSWEAFEREVDEDDLPVYVIVDECLFRQKDHRGGNGKT